MNDKKFLIIGTIIIIALLIVAVVIAGKGEEKKQNDLPFSNDPETIIANAEKESAAVVDGAKKEFDRIDVAKYLEYYAGDVPTLVLVAREGCHYCQTAEPIIQSIMKENDISINYLDTDEFTEETSQQFQESDAMFEDGFGTPMLLLVGNNSIIDAVDGLTDKAHYVEFFRSNGFINE